MRSIRARCDGPRTYDPIRIGSSWSDSTSNTGKTPGVAALFSCTGSGEPDSSYV